MGKGKEELEEIKNKLEILSKNVLEIKSSVVEQFLAQKDSLKKDITDLKEDLKQYLSETEKNNQEKMMDISNLIVSRGNLQEKKMEELKEEFTKIEQKIEEQQKILKEKEDEIRRLNTLLDEKDAAFFQQKEKHSLIEKELEEKLREYNNLKLECEQLNVENTDLTTKKAEMEKRLEEMKTKLEEKEKELENIKEELQKIKETAAEKEKELIQEHEKQKTKEIDSLLRILLNSTDHGKVYLALQESETHSLSLDELSTIVNLSAVEVKRAVSFMHEIGVIIYKPEARMVMLAN